MKKQDYRCAVGSIHWPPEKRREIDAALSCPAGRRAKNEIEQIIRQDRKQKKQEQKKKQYVSEVEIVKKETRKSKILLVILAAALLAVGGTAAAVAYRAHKRVQQDDLESKLTEEETPPDLENAVISPQLTDQQDRPDSHRYAETDSGFFYLSQSTDYIEVTKDGHTWHEPEYHTGLKYCDLESGDTVFVCAKPNCLHDGSEFCTATTKNYEIASEPVWLDGYVYLIALDKRELLKNPEGCTRFPAVLLRYSPDGTEITEAAQLRLSEHQYAIGAEIIAHRGQLWISCSYEEYWNTYDANMQLTSSETKGLWEMYCYEPESKKLTTLVSSGEAQKGYQTCTIINGGSGSLNAPYASDLKGIGDYVYFHKIKCDWRDPVKDAGIFHIDCRTGVITKDVKLVSNKSVLYQISGNLAYYTFDPKYNASFTASDACKICCYDMTDGTETQLATMSELAKEVLPDLTEEDWDNTYRQNIFVHMQNLFVAGGKLYLFWTFQDLRNDFTGEQQSFISEFDRTAAPHTVKLDVKMQLPENIVRQKVEKNGYWGQEKTWIAPEDITDEDTAFIRSNGCYETADGEWLDPRQQKEEDWERLQNNGFYYDKWFSYTPDQVTDEIFQRAMKDWGTDSLSLDSAAFNGKAFYLHGWAGFYRMTPEALLTNGDAEMITLWDWEG